MHRRGTEIEEEIFPGYWSFETQCIFNHYSNTSPGLNVLNQNIVYNICLIFLYFNIEILYCSIIPIHIIYTDDENLVKMKVNKGL